MKNHTKLSLLATPLLLAATPAYSMSIELQFIKERLNDLWQAESKEAGFAFRSVKATKERNEKEWMAKLEKDPRLLDSINWDGVGILFKSVQTMIHKKQYKEAQTQCQELIKSYDKRESDEMTKAKLYWLRRYIGIAGAGIIMLSQKGKMNRAAFAGIGLATCLPFAAHNPETYHYYVSNFEKAGLKKYWFTAKMNQIETLNKSRKITDTTFNNITTQKN